MSLVFSFAPIVSDQARILILGSMPGTASLAAGQYYAHPRNSFWPIMGELFGTDAALPYVERCAMLAQQGVAVWDVLQSCSRPGSLDAAIDKSTMLANDFNGFLTSYPQINSIYFNGNTAEQSFRKQVLPSLKDKELHLQGLPSTSPAHAALSFTQKCEQWRVILSRL
jgi:hypoxanthine-DNA glycosylase